MFPRFFRKRYGYSRWDGTQRLEGLNADEVLKSLADDYLERGDLDRSLRQLMQRGIRREDGRPTQGLRDILNRLRDRRQEQLSRYNMASGVMNDIREKLEEIKQLEREGIQQRLDEQNAPASEEDTASKQKGGDDSELSEEQKRKMLEMIAQRKLDFLQKLPKDVPNQLKSFSDYDFLDDRAREKFQNLISELQQQTMQQFFQGMQESIQNMSPEDVTKMREMIRDLNQMLRERQQGQEPDFDSFMQKHGQYFPGVNTLDDLIEQMQQQMAAMQGVMDQLSPEQRSELQRLMDQLMGDDRIRVDMMELAMNLSALSPLDQAGQRYSFSGEENVPLGEAVNMMGRLQQMEGLEQELEEARRLDDISEIDTEKVRELLGAEEYQSLEELKSVAKTLEEAGYMVKRGKHWELTGPGMRKIGQKALQDIFNKLKRDDFGRHVTPFRGTGGERTDESKTYEFGDPFLLDLQKTVINGVTRHGVGTPIKLRKEDFEVYRTEFTTRSSTVLMIDMSRSMVFNGCQQVAKKVGIALESLIRSQFPRDSLSILGFSYVAHEFKPNELFQLSSYDNQQGTNMAHGLMLARQLLAKQGGGNKQIIMITDGGPTVWYDQHTESWQFAFPSFEAEAQTLLEVQRCTRENIVINTFMLYDDLWMRAFIKKLAEINRGRTFYVDKDNLGEYLLVDYLNSKRKIIF